MSLTYALLNFCHKIKICLKIFFFYFVFVIKIFYYSTRLCLMTTKVSRSKKILQGRLTIFHKIDWTISYLSKSEKFFKWFQVNIVLLSFIPSLIEIICCIFFIFLFSPFLKRSNICCQSLYSKYLLLNKL